MKKIITCNYTDKSATYEINTVFYTVLLYLFV